MSRGADLTSAAGFLVETYDERGQRDREAKIAAGGFHAVDGTWGVNERIRRIMARERRSAYGLTKAELWIAISAVSDQSSMASNQQPLHFLFSGETPLFNG